ncbi:hypothetical protein AAVH_30887 [Aphelenchoides avenae]|nr:hypothetical protein AAVH_30887 [Aphelenchus avenae]
MVDVDYGDIENDRFGLNEAKTMYEKEQWASDAQMLIMNQLSSAEVRNASFTYDEFIKACYYNGVPCAE